MATFARSNRVVFNVIICVVPFLFFMSLYHVSYNYNDIIDKVNGKTSPEKHAPNTPPKVEPPKIGTPKLEDANVAAPKVEAPPKVGAPKVDTKRPSFREIGKKFGTDKVTAHHYQHMYEKYLEPLRDEPLKMLEIGLGCDMSYGPGASYHTWLEFFPKVDLYYIEYDAACAEKWAANTTGATIFTGDQADVPFLKKFLNETGGGFDVIIDDGGHTMEQQKTSIDILFDSVKPGGIYFVEDLETSYAAKYGGGQGVATTFVERVKASLDGMMLSKPTPYFMAHVYSVDCMKEVCAFSKKMPGETYD
ncbi:hypothetical protein VC83_00635 [Pseudogymnoascus destructans]|uniref:Hard-surface induced protein 5 n=2 Tax=Pseudogymnoascus destructans TaxID=655981 RepID=L8FP80_PSED2|nr:uncharacterized protein VC83_00635 [Pseudogymnoascus destructans]ELR02268.1 hypothetical protein GMDG_05338 [Pseudogymnoascus destructans 20631-21]OAF63183.1 hypothetical protein VC83_00635 [Pseudogymnoascus destructans]